MLHNSSWFVALCPPKLMPFSESRSLSWSWWVSWVYQGQNYRCWESFYCWWKSGMYPCLISAMAIVLPWKMEAVSWVGRWELLVVQLLASRLIFLLSFEMDGDEQWNLRDSVTLWVTLLPWNMCLLYTWLLSPFFPCLFSMWLQWILMIPSLYFPFIINVLALQ